MRGNLIRFAQNSPTKDYINLILLGMLRHAQSDWDINDADGLPAPQYGPDFDMTGVTFDRVVNRLKVMSGLDPVTYRDPREGAIELVINGVNYVANTRFMDQSTRIVHLHLRRVA